jgi:hypothetical protein
MKPNPLQSNTPRTSQPKLPQVNTSAFPELYCQVEVDDVSVRLFNLGLRRIEILLQKRSYQAAPFEVSSPTRRGVVDIRATFHNQEILDNVVQEITRIKDYFFVERKEYLALSGQDIIIYSESFESKY